MSKVNLNSIVYYDGDRDLKPVKDRLPLTGIEKSFPGIRFPKSGMTLLYGHRNPAASYLLEKTPKNMCAESVDLHVEIGKWQRQKVDLSDQPEFGLQFTRFLSVVRAKKQLIDKLEAVWVKSLGESWPEGEQWPRGPTTHANLLDDLILLPEFKHLAVIAYTVVEPEIGEFQVATVFDFEAITMIDAGWRLQGVQFDLIIE